MRDKPSDNEVRHELDRVLGWEEFKASAKKTNFLRFAVDCALQNRSIDAKDVGEEVWGGNYNPENATIRVHATLIRDNLNEYYKTVGKDDLVRIDLPAGAGYKPIFQYNSEAQVIKSYRLGTAHCHKLDRQSLLLGEAYLQEVIRSNPAYEQAYTRDLEVQLAQVIMDRVLTVGGSFTGLDWVQYPAAKAAKCAAAVPLTQTLLAVFFALRGDFVSAKERIEQARSISKEETEDSLWYATYLAVTGQMEQAISVAEGAAAVGFEHSTPSLVYGFFLYLDRQFDKVIQASGSMLGVGDGFLIQMLLWGLTYLSLESFDGALDCFERASELSNDEWEVLKEKFKLGDSGEKPERYPGFISYCHAKRGASELVDSRYEVLLNLPYISPLQLAFAHLASGDASLAVRALQDAWSDSDTVWVARLPLFDPFRHYLDEQ